MIPARLSYRTRRLRLPRSRGPSPRNSVPAERRPAQECRRLTDPRRPGIAKDARTAPRYARTADKQRPLPLRLRRQCREPPRARKDRESGETKESSAPSRSHRRAPDTRRVSPRPAFLPSDRLPADALQILVRAAEMAAAEKSPIGRQGRRMDRLENAVALRIDNRSLALRIRAP